MILGRKMLSEMSGTEIEALSSIFVSLGSVYTTTIATHRARNRLWIKEICCIGEAVPPTLRRVRKAPKRKPPNERARHYIELQREVQKLLLLRLRSEEAPRRLELPHVGKGLAAELAGVTPAHLRSFEKGETPLNEDKRARLMAAYGITYREWLELELKVAKEVANRPYELVTTDPAAVAEAKQAVGRRRRRGGRGGEQE